MLLCALLELNLLQIARQALHNKLRAVDSCTTKDTWWRRWRGEEGDSFSFPRSKRGGGSEAKIYVLSGSCNKTNGRGDAELGTNMKGSGVWQQGAGAPLKDWMKLSLYNQGASAWLPPPLPTDR